MRQSMRRLCHNLGFKCIVKCILKDIQYSPKGLGCVGVLTRIPRYFPANLAQESWAMRKKLVKTGGYSLHPVLKDRKKR